MLTDELLISLMVCRKEKKVREKKAAAFRIKCIYFGREDGFAALYYGGVLLQSFCI